MQHFLPYMLKFSASAINMLHKSKTYWINKSSGDRNTARFFSPPFQMAKDERQLEFWSLLNLPNSLLSK